MQEVTVDLTIPASPSLFKKWTWAGNELRRKSGGGLDPAVREMVEEEYPQATGVTPYEALFAEREAGRLS